MKRYSSRSWRRGLAATSLSVHRRVRVGGRDVVAVADRRAHADRHGTYSGYSSSGVATPVKIEIFEPTIPIPATPQLEVELRLHQGQGGHRQHQGPGQLPVARRRGRRGAQDVRRAARPADARSVENGYPVQVNSLYPSGSTKQQNEPFPGTSMTATSGKGSARATVGFSTDCNAR